MAALLLGVLLLGVAPDCGYQFELKVKSSVNIIHGFGSLVDTIRSIHGSGPSQEPTVGRDGFFQEATVDILQDLSKPSQSLAPDRGPVNQGDFHIAFCDNTRQLLQTYFRGFTIENVEKSSYAFTSRWMKKKCADSFGLDTKFFGDPYSYILVRVSRYRSLEHMTPSQNRQVRLDREVEFELTAENVTSVQHFVDRFGTHYISSYITGDALYQVFAYRESIYLRIKDRIQAEGVSSITSAELTSYFTPWFADHTGRILSASSNTTVEAWAEKWLKFQFYIFSFQSLIQLLHTGPVLIRKSDKNIIHLIQADPVLPEILDGFLGETAVLQLEFRSLAPAFTDARRRQSFNEYVDNKLALHEMNVDICHVSE